MRNLQLWLQDILRAIEKIEGRTEKSNIELFLQDEDLQVWVLYHLQIIGEASKQVPQKIKDNSLIPWREIGRFRDLLVHRYFKVDLEMVWDVVRENLPPLKREVQSLLSEIENNSDKQNN